jgi:threonine dehydratase
MHTSRDRVLRTRMPNRTPAVTDPSSTLTADRVRQVADAIRPYIRRTPTLTIDGSDVGCPGVTVTFKLEQHQRAGSFKTRGAFANLLLRDVPASGVVAASGGNHGAAVAYAARQLGVPAAIFVPRVASRAKVEAIRASGAQLHITGERYADALAASEAWSARTGALAVHAFDSEFTVLGQSTLGVELLDQASTIETILVAVGGGGLLAGLAVGTAGRVRLVGVEPVGAPTLTMALERGEPVDAPADGIAADSLAPRRVGALTFSVIRTAVRDVRLVTDDQIREAQRALWSVARIVAEPGGAAAFAALRHRVFPARPGEHVAVVISGANTTAVTFD